jgi:ABC-2 type transport system permease protein
MRLYYEIALRSFRRATIYRTTLIAGMLTNAFFGALRCFVYQAVYQNGGSVAGFTLSDAISYSWATQSLISIGAGWITLDIATTISSGAVVADLARPWNFYGYWLSRSLGERVFNLLVRGALTYAIGVAFFGARVPAAAEALAFAIAISLALLISFAFSFIVQLSAFWLIDITGVVIFANALLSVFSGFLLPLAFFPPLLARVAAMLPFQAITALPVEIFLGRISGAAVIGTLLLQLGWLAALTIAGLLTMRAAVHKVVIQGG